MKKKCILYFLLLFYRGIKEEDEKNSGSNKGFDADLDEVNEALKEEEKKKIQKANLERLFFSQATKAKQSLGLKHPGYYTDTRALFNYAIQNSISVDNWANFITEEITQRSDKWVDAKKVKLLNQM